MIDEIKEKILLKISIALDNPVSAETLGIMGDIISKFEANDIKRENKLCFADVKEDLISIVEAIPTGKSDKTNKKEVL